MLYVVDLYDYQLGVEGDKNVECSLKLLCLFRHAFTGPMSTTNCSKL